jgi:hypothetical protein
MKKPVVIFGAGATKACGGPLTNEIPPQAFEPTVRSEIAREGYDDLLERFLIARITVVEYDPTMRSVSEHAVGARYRSLFGDGIKWRTDGFESYVDSSNR